MKKNCLLKYISIIVGTIIFLIVPIVLFITNQDDKIKSTYILYFIVIASIFIHIIIYCVANNSFKRKSKKKIIENLRYPFYFIFHRIILDREIEII